MIELIKRNETESVFGTIKDYKEKRYLDIRVWYKGKNANEWLPTKKGITAELGQVDQMMKNLNKLLKEAGK